jgi:hypothetical protein
MINPFTLSFINAHEDAFSEYVALGTLIAQRAAEGKESIEQYQKAIRLQTVLKARRNTELTAKQEEALDGCLGLLSEAQFTPTVSPLYTTDDGFLIYVQGGRIQYVGGGFILPVES